MPKFWYFWLIFEWYQFAIFRYFTCIRPTLIFTKLQYNNYSKYSQYVSCLADISFMHIYAYASRMPFKQILISIRNEKLRWEKGNIIFLICCWDSYQDVSARSQRAWDRKSRWTWNVLLHAVHSSFIFRHWGNQLGKLGFAGSHFSYPPRRQPRPRFCGWLPAVHARPFWLSGSTICIYLWRNCLCKGWRPLS